MAEADGNMGFPGSAAPAAPAMPAPPPRPTFAQQRAAQDAGRAPAPARPQAPAPAPPPPAQATPPADAAQRVKIGDAEFDESEIRDALTLKAERDSQRAQLASPEAYELKMPDGWKPGDNQPDVKFNPDAPEAKSLRDWAHRHNLPQAALSEALAMYAATQAPQLAALDAARTVELGKLGPLCAVRVNTACTWMNAMIGEAAAKPLTTFMREAPIADMITGFESLMRRFADNNPVHPQALPHYRRPGEQQDTVNIPGIDKMGFREARAAQDQLAARQRQAGT